MPVSHVKMSRAQRAKQFLPFAGVKGLDEALSMKELELEYEDAAFLSDDRFEELNRILDTVEPGCRIEIEYYNGQRYVRQISTVIKIGRQERVLMLKDMSVPFEQIRSLTLIL